MNNEFGGGRSRTHGITPLIPEGSIPMRDSGRSLGENEMEKVAQIPIDHQVGDPPKTASELQNPRQGRGGGQRQNNFLGDL